jgi:hypothetical protein
MPFTFSHPAIVLPLTFLPRQWFSLTGLVIGSLTPDFEYFLRMKVKSDYSHTIIGLFWFDLPLALVLAFLFHNIVRDSLFNNLPFALKARFSTFKDFNWNSYFKANWFVVAISIIIGSASHLLWDSFTHKHGFFVEALPGLTETIGLLNKQIAVYKILQHSSTLFGGTIISLALYNIPVDKKVSNKLSIRYWIILAAITLMVVALRLIGGLEYNLYGHLIATAIGATLISLNLTPLLIRQK